MVWLWGASLSCKEWGQVLHLEFSPFQCSPDREPHLLMRDSHPFLHPPLHPKHKAPVLAPRPLLTRVAINVPGPAPGRKTLGEEKVDKFNFNYRDKLPWDRFKGRGVGRRPDLRFDGEYKQGVESSIGN